MKTSIWILGPLFVASICWGGGKDLTSKRGKLLMKEDFAGAALPELFTMGRGDWKIVDGTLRGRQLAADNHTAFRKIYLDHDNVIYEYDMKLEGDGFHQLLINWDLAHIAKCVIRYDSIALFKIREKGKREQMTREKRDQGRDPLQGKWDEPNVTLDEAKVSLKEGKWYHVVVELVGDRLSMRVDGQTISGRHIGLTEKKDNFGFQAGGLESYVFIDNVRVFEALPKGF